MSDTNDVLGNLRKDYASQVLLEDNIDANPIMQFDIWMNDAISVEIDHLNAMTLSTVSKDGFPSSRVVLLKSFDKDGFKFYTNYQSRKGVELIENPNAALNLDRKSTRLNSSH